MRERSLAIAAGLGRKTPTPSRVDALRDAQRLAEQFADDDGRLTRPVYFTTLNFRIPAMLEREGLRKATIFRDMIDRQYFGRRYDRLPQEERTAVYFAVFEDRDSTVSFPHVHMIVAPPAGSTRRRAEEFPEIARAVFPAMQPQGQIFVGFTERPDGVIRNSFEFATVLNYVLPLSA